MWGFELMRLRWMHEMKVSKKIGRGGEGRERMVKVETRGFGCVVLAGPLVHYLVS